MADYSDFFVGPHSILVRNGLTLNDRTQYERYRIDDFTGFGLADLRVGQTENSMDDGELPDLGFYGGRTMTLTGAIEASTYSRLLQMGKALDESFIDLVELPMTITKKPGSFVKHDDVTINCRLSDKPEIDRKLQQSDLGAAKFKRPFTVALHATNPVYQGITRQHVSLLPVFLSNYGRTYDKAYDIAYTTLLDPGAIGQGNVATLQNYGNWDARPVIRFNGGLDGVVLTNAANGHQIKLNYRVATGDYIEIDIAAGSVVDRNGNNRSSYFNDASDWLQLQGKRASYTGLNTINLSATWYDASGSVDIWWYDALIG